jgi:hypothetical protein
MGVAAPTPTHQLLLPSYGCRRQLLLHPEPGDLASPTKTYSKEKKNLLKDGWDGGKFGLN